MSRTAAPASVLVVVLAAPMAVALHGVPACAAALARPGKRPPGPAR